MYRNNTRGEKKDYDKRPGHNIWSRYVLRFSVLVKGAGRTILSDMNNKFDPRSANPELQIIEKRHNSVKSKQLHRTLREIII
jgi:hypothetical protein